MNNNQINKTLITFWDNAIALSEEEKKELRDPSFNYKDLAPSTKLFEAVSTLGKRQHVLDYGCGNAWGAIIVSKSGCLDVLGVDLGKKIIETASIYKDIFNAPIKLEVIDENWLKQQKEATFDGIICSNVLDVLPLDTSKDIIKNLARVSQKDASVIVGLNFYMPAEAAKERGMEIVEDKYLFVNGVLRLLSLSDDQWEELFSPYFTIDKKEYFAWPGENKETRRLFYLRKK